MTAYYNENDKFSAAWLRELIQNNLIARGEVDERSIKEVSSSDVAGYSQCHFFAGIGGWSLALRLAGVPDEARVWTGSCPCQPFSIGGDARAYEDERHLWPEFFRLIQVQRPERVFGEQVAANLGWLDMVQDDLESEGYAVGSASLSGSIAGAFHARQRLYFLGTMADTDIQRSQGWCSAVGEAFWTERQTAPRSAPAGAWGNAVAARCRDGVQRATEPGSAALAHGIPARVGRLRGYGNAIIPQVAAQFIKAALQ